jgi:chromate reductase
MSGSEAVTVLGISGSLRQGSYNAAALREAVRLAPQGMKIQIGDISEVPLYNEDVYAKGFPPAVERLREQVRAADALLIVTPEYNYSIPGVLKNVIDWISRPPDQPFAAKPAAVMGASAGRFGTARAQYHLRQSMVYLDLRFLNRPEVMIGNAGEHFDAAGNLIDEQTRKQIRRLLEALYEQTVKAKG